MLDSLLCLCLLVLCIPADDSSIYMTQEYDNGQFKLTCTQSDNYNSYVRYWHRGNNQVLTTYFNGYILFSNFGNDLRSRTTASAKQSNHQIKIKDEGRDRDRYWACCRYLHWYYDCSKWILVKRNPTSDIGAKTMSPPSTPTTPPEIVMPLMGNATLSLTGATEALTEDQQITLSCTTDMQIQDEAWIVFWLKNDHPTLITHNSSSVTSVENLPERIVHLRNASKKYEDMVNKWDDIFQNVSVSVISDDFQQNITFAVSASLIGRSFWRCGSPYATNLSNTLPIEVIPKTLTSITSDQTETTLSSTLSSKIYSTESVTSDQAETTLSSTLSSKIYSTESVTSDQPETTLSSTLSSKIYSTESVTSEDGFTAVSATASGIGGDDEDTKSTTIYTVAGCGIGVVFLVLFLVLLMIVFRRRRKKTKYMVPVSTNKRNEEALKESIIMEDNILYASNKDNMQTMYKDDERVTEDNVLYESSDDHLQESKSSQHDDEVMQDNVLYVSSDGFRSPRYV